MVDDAPETNDEGDLRPALNRLLAQRTARLARQALDADGRVEPVDVQAAQNLADVVELLGRTRPHLNWRRAPLLIALAAAAILAFSLSVLRVGQTEIALDLSVSEVTLRLAKAREIVPALSLASLGIVGAQSIELPAVLDPALRTAAGEAAAAVRLETVAGAGSIDLGPLTLPKAARVSLSVNDSASPAPATEPGRYRLTLADAPAQLGASVRGSVRYTVAGQAPETRDAAVPKPVWARSGTGPLDLELALATARSVELASPIDIDGLSLQHIDAPRSGDSEAPQPVSSLRAGTLYLVALDSKERKLLAHELLGWEQIRGQVSALRLEPGQITLRLQASVRGLVVGSGENRRSLMPTWLEWLRERHGLSLFWGSAVYMFGLMTGIVRWWSSPS